MKTLIFLLLTSLSVYSQSASVLFQKNIQTSVATNRHLEFLPIAIISALLSWDYFKEADKLADQINELHKNNPEFDTSRLKNDRLRKNIIGCALAITTISFTIYSTKKHEIKIKNNQVHFSYHFK